MICKFRSLLSLKASRGLSSLKTEGSVFVRSAPGTRTLELAQPYEGNFITEDTLKSLSLHLKKIEDNHTVPLMIFASRSPNRFSDGFVRSSRGVAAKVVKAANALSLSISVTNKESIVVYSGSFDDTAYSTFAACKVSYLSVRLLVTSW